ncbi:hypothetical protein [Actinomadura sp. NBRC 104425]|uniref:hypothetical protein n=1 Tax=Actinomadura sp. NBRC 104425 TaxID=3032204 RepID=UPI002555D832|nr:hypothetical protein [Actinomadura sp. NBRC 104425]
MGDQFPGWGITTDAAAWTARRAMPPFGGFTEIAAPDAGSLFEVLTDVAELDDRHTLRVLRVLLHQHGVAAAAAGLMLTVPRPDGIDAVVTCDGGTVRWEGRDIGARTNLRAVAQWIVTSLRSAFLGTP